MSGVLPFEYCPAGKQLEATELNQYGSCYAHGHIDGTAQGGNVQAAREPLGGGDHEGRVRPPHFGK